MFGAFNPRSGQRNMLLSLGSLTAILFIFYLVRLPSDTHTLDLHTAWGRVVTTNSAGKNHDNRHPVERLVAQSEAAFKTLTRKQSKTITEASAEYTRRYGRRPPPGFDRWFGMAKDHDMVLVDEFDSVMASLEPFWGVHPKTLHARVEEMSKAGNLMRLVLNDTGLVNTVGKIHQHFALIQRVLDPLPWRDVIDEVDFIVSTMDEPRVSVPAEALELAKSYAKTQKSTIDGKSPEIEPADADLHVHGFGHENIWEWLVDACRMSDPARTWEASYEDFNSTNPDLSFVDDRAAIIDPCMDPTLHHYHSIWTSPSVVSLTKHLVPVFSQARPTRFNDILYPSPFYIERMEDKTENKQVDPEIDLPWEQKLDRVYWVGTANAGWATPENWFKLNRQRMTIMTGSESPQPVPLLERTSIVGSEKTTWKAKTGLLWKDISQYFHLRISRIDWCPNPSCDVQEAYFHPEREEQNDVLKNKYCLDLDGTSYSGRYYRLLRSSCAVIKQTLFNEWHDDWLMPWVHYIPLSPRGYELGEVTRFLIEEPEGREIGRKIADQGRSWSKRLLREEDIGLVILRILMEYQRIMSLNRDELFYSG